MDCLHSLLELYCLLHLSLVLYLVLLPEDYSFVWECEDDVCSFCSYDHWLFNFRDYSDGNLLFILFAVILTFMSYSAIQVSLNTFIENIKSS